MRRARRGPPRHARVVKIERGAGYRCGSIACDILRIADQHQGEHLTQQRSEGLPDDNEIFRTACPHVAGIACACRGHGAAHAGRNFLRRRMSDPTLVIKGMPSDLKHCLFMFNEAARNGRSMSDEAVCLLATARAVRETVCRRTRNPQAIGQILKDLQGLPLLDARARWTRRSTTRRVCPGEGAAATYANTAVNTTLSATRPLP